MGFKQIEEAIALRNQVLDRLDVAASVRDATTRARALTFVFVGGGYAGVEAMAEIEDMARFATRTTGAARRRPAVRAGRDGSNRILPEVGEDLGAYTVEQLRKRGIEVRLEHRARVLRRRARRAVRRRGVRRRHDRLDGRRARPTRCSAPATCRSTSRAGCAPTPDLRVDGVEHAWTAGDNAAVPDLTQPGAALRPERPARRAPGADCSRTTSSGRCAASPESTTGTSTSARSPASACTRAWRRCTASSCGVPGLVHAPDLPHEPDADVQQEGARGARLDAGAVLPARGRLARHPAPPSATTSTAPPDSRLVARADAYDGRARPRIPTAEEAPLKGAQCGFESHRGHEHGAKSPAQRARRC